MKYFKCYPDFKFKAVTFSFDDGTYHDIEMIEIMNKFNLKGTFNLNSKLMYPNSKFVMSNWINCYRLDRHQINEIYKGHEIASHTSTHTDFAVYDDTPGIGILVCFDCLCALPGDYHCAVKR